MNDDTQYSDLLDADDLFEGAEWYDEYDEDIEIIEEDFDDDLDEDLDDLMAEMFGSLTPAESFNIGKALGSIGSGAVQVLSDPTVRQVAATAAPIALGAAGTAVAGPGVGTAVGASLGQVAGQALAPKPEPAPKAPVAATPPATAPVIAPKPVPAVTAPAPPAKPVPVPSPTVPAPLKPAAAQGSAAATQALVLSQRPDVLKCLLALALGQRGPSDVNGVPVGAVMNMLASIYGKAAEDADELLYADESTPSYLLDADGYLSADPAAPRERADALYAALIGAENEYLAETGLA